MSRQLYLGCKNLCKLRDFLCGGWSFLPFMSHNGLRLGVVRVFGEVFVGKTNAYLETSTPFYLNARITPNRCVCLEWQMYNSAMRSTNCLKKQFILSVKARNIIIHRFESLTYAGITSYLRNVYLRTISVESLTYAGVTPRSISKLRAIGGWFGVIHALKLACLRVGQVSRTAKVGTDK
ncbi:MAG: hypothetical protein IPO98_16575 [Saprospiraceae bacterium]|nr:hypothetical protein [Saprospiraceae bacterium]